MIHEATSFWIAAKLLEVNVPELNDLVHVSGGSFNVVDILFKENQILDTLKYELLTPTAICFLEPILFSTSEIISDKVNQLLFRK